MGRLRPHEHDPRTVRDRRGQLLRSGRQPARRQRAHAGARRWYFILPATLGGYLAGERLVPVSEDGTEAVAAVAEVRARLEKLLAPKGRRTASDFHRALGRVLRDACGMERS